MPRVVAIRTTPDELLGAAVVLLDVTKFHLLDRLKSDMLSTVSHELKTPLTSVQMAVHLLLEEVVGPLTPKQVELLLAARQDSDRILTMINNLLDLTRIEQGRVRLDLEPVLAAELVEGAAARMKAQAEDAGIALETEIEGEPTSVMVDGDRIEHVFDNLIINAIQHTPRGGSSGSGSARNRTDWYSRSRTPARGSRRNTCRVSSKNSTGSPMVNRSVARASVWRSFAISSPLTGGRSRSAASPVEGQASPSPCHATATLAI